MRKNFIRKKEDFTCENCGEFVSGDGYTDHCPKCLYGKHVDEKIPGDRESTCGGSMKPIGLTIKGRKHQIQYCCETCGKTFSCKVAKADNARKIIVISS